MNDDEFGMMVRRRETFEALAKGAKRQDWPKLWQQAERSARAGAMQPRLRIPVFDPDSIYRSLAQNERTSWKVDPAIRRALSKGTS